MYLEKINSPKDMKTMSMEELGLLCSEVRETLLTKLSNHGGHIGPNLGVVELTVAMHHVFNSPVDKFVYDVSHQSYIHKMLTGRKDAFLNPEKYHEVSGYTNPHESEHDLFNVGHTSTSVSLACGLVKARDLKGTNENIIAIIGDGSLSGGEAFEGLNNAAETGTNMIIVVNDNDQSISENHGGMYKKFADLRASNGKAECNFFKSMGLDYIYVEDGHDVAGLVKVFQSVKDTDRPIVIHVHTIKGKGYKPAEENKEMYHAGSPFNRETGEYMFSWGSPDGYENRTAEFLLDLMKKDPAVAMITSGTPTGFAFSQDRREQAGKQYVDVGIAEEHAVALASGMAKNGAKPVYCVFSTFLQRTYDQLSQDLCVNNNPALILVFGASVSGMFNDVTHLGFFDIPMMANIPNLVYLAPTCKEEYFAMLEWGIHQTEHPVAIRVPAMGVVESGVSDSTDYSILNKYQVNKKGSKVAIVALGSFYPLGESIVDTLAKENGMEATLVNPKYITGLDENVLDSLKENHELVITLEDGVLDGGFGERIASYYGSSDMKVKNYGIKKGFPDRYNPEALLKENGVSTELIVADINNILNR